MDIDLQLIIKLKDHYNTPIFNEYIKIWKEMNSNE